LTPNCRIAAPIICKVRTDHVNMDRADCPSCRLWRRLLLLALSGLAIVLVLEWL
jgi:hypothetical protein